MMRIRWHAICIILLGVTPAMAEDFLDDATIRIRPGNDQAAGLRRPEGIGQVTLIADDAQSKLANVRFQPTEPADLYRLNDRLDPCSAGGDTAYRTWIYQVTAPQPNADVSCLFDGVITTCSGAGGKPPPFQAAIVHVDLDVDSDNSSDVVTVQKAPKKQDINHRIGQFPEADLQEMAEDPQGEANLKEPGLVLIVNHGFEQIPFNPANPIEDFQRPDSTTVIDPSDLDLAKGRIQITGQRSGKMTVSYSSKQLRVYRLDKGAPQLVQTGIETDESPGEIPLLLEGVDPGSISGDSRITVNFKPAGSQYGNSPAQDVVKVTVVDLQLQVDRDRDNKVTGINKDLTDVTRPFTFWFNNDSDVGWSFADGPPDVSDFRYDFLLSNSAPGKTNDPRIDLRDLEDYQRLRCRIRGVDKLLDSQLTSSGMRWMPGAKNGPQIRCFYNQDVTGSIDYLRQEQTAISAIKATQGKESILVRGEEFSRIHQSIYKAEADARVASLLWKCSSENDRRTSTPEAAGSAKPEEADGRLGFGLFQGTGPSRKLLAINRHMHMYLADIRWFYEHWTLGDGYTEATHFPMPTITKATDSPVNLSDGPQVGLYNEELRTLPGVTKTIIFIHGYRMQTWERRAFAETMMKRLYWQRYGGRFVLISWPTEFHANPYVGGAFEPQNYDRSEFTARRSGIALKDLLESIRDRLTVFKPNNLIISAHSMGNIVTSEALRQAKKPLVGTYLSFQSAESAGCYRLDAPPLVPRGVIDDQTFKLRYTPDLYRFDQPVPNRALVTRNLKQWDTGRRNQKEVLRPGIDGFPLHADMANVVAKRVTYFNGSDPATTSSWARNQFSKPDDNFYYFPEVTNNFSDNKPTYRDTYYTNAYVDLNPWNNFPTSTFSHSFFEVPWTSHPSLGIQADGHAAILAFFTRSQNIAVGSTNGARLIGPSGPDERGRVPPPGYRECPFTEAFDARTLSGFSDDAAHDHSGQFEYYIQRAPGPLNFWGDVLQRIK